MTISVSLENTRSTNLKVRLVGSRDGRYLDVMLPPGQFNVDDLPTYEVKIPAPAAVLSYQFIIHQPDGSLVPSKRFTVQRPCVQNYVVNVPDDRGDASFRREIAILVAKQHKLAQEVKSYEAALKIIDDLKASLPNDEVAQ